MSKVKVADLFSIINASFGFLAIYYNNPSLIFVSALADGFDGYFARKFGSGELGKFLDALADLVSFGVAPAYFIGIYALPYFLAALYRLSRFVTLKTENFVGFPVTSSAMIVVPLLYYSKNAAAVSSLILSFFMVSSIEYRKIKDERLLSLAAVSIILAAVKKEFSILILSLSTLYLLSPLAKNLYKPR